MLSVCEAPFHIDTITYLHRALKSPGFWRILALKSLQITCNTVVIDGRTRVLVVDNRNVCMSVLLLGSSAWWAMVDWWNVVCWCTCYSGWWDLTSAIQRALLIRLRYLWLPFPPVIVFDATYLLRWDSSAATIFC